MTQDQTPSKLLKSINKRPVQLTITINDQEKQQQPQRPPEKLIDVDQDGGWETVEVAGFVFKRRKTDQHHQQQPHNVTPEHTPLAVAPETCSRLHLPTLSISSTELHTLLEACSSSTTGTTDAPSTDIAEFAQRLRLAVGVRLQPCVNDAAVPVGERLTAKALLQELQARKRVLLARLQQQRMEEEEWVQLASSTHHMQQDVARMLASSTPDGGAAGDVASGDIQVAMRATPCAGQLRAAQQQLQQALTVQAEGLCAAVEKSKVLLESAEHCCHEIQNKYHQEKFKTFPDMDSPAALIKRLTATGPAAAV